MTTRPGAILSVLAASVIMLATAAAQAEKKTAASGKTQVVANAGGREITLSELRLEMARLGLSPADPGAERIALESLLNRTLLSKAARAAALHRKPETMARMHAAQDQALADYFLALASQPPEPTREEIDDYISRHKSLFAGRKTYVFSILTLETKNFRESALTPLFDQAHDFARLAVVLEKAGARYSVAAATQSGAVFPEPVREQLAKYGVHDNIVIKGDQETQIMKIVEIREDPGSAADWAPLARRLLLDEAAAKRAADLLARLKKEASVAYYRPTAAPPAEVAGAKK